MNQVLQLSQTARRVEAFVATEAGRDAVAYLMRQAPDGNQATYHTGTLETLSRLSGMTEFGDIVLAELGASPLGDTLELLRDVVADGVEIVLVGPEIDVPTYRAYLAGGVKDYLIVPHQEGDPLPDLWSASTALTAPPTQRGKSVAVCGVCGGVGASLLATIWLRLWPLRSKPRGKIKWRLPVWGYWMRNCILAPWPLSWMLK